MPDRTIHPYTSRSAPSGVGSRPAPCSLRVEPLREGVLDIWRVDLASAGDEIAQLLSPAERHRAAAIAGERRRALWMRGRGVLRALLGSYVGHPPRRLEIVTGAHGKPALAPGPGGAGSGGAGSGGAGSEPRPALSFNLSHSGTWALYAFATGAPVGIDLEVARGRRVDAVGLTMRVFGPEQARRVRALPSSLAREGEFLRLWVAYEARLKCLGLALIEKEAQPTVATQLWLAELDLGPDMTAAVAVQAGAQELRLWEHPTPGS
jgi:4'-phosphopantetheinyl transferase